MGPGQVGPQDVRREGEGARGGGGVICRKCKEVGLDFPHALGSMASGHRECGTIPTPSRLPLAHHLRPAMLVQGSMSQSRTHVPAIFSAMVIARPYRHAPPAVLAFQAIGQDARSTSRERAGMVVSGKVRGAANDGLRHGHAGLHLATAFSAGLRVTHRGAP